MIYPSTYNLPLIIKRSDYDFTVQLLEFSESPLNVAEYLIIAQLWDRKREVKYLDFFVEIVDDVEGIVNFSLSSTQTPELPITGVYDVKIINLNTSKEYYVLKGNFTTSEGYSDD